MKIVRYRDETGVVKLGATKGDGLIDLNESFPALSDNTIELISHWAKFRSEVEKNRC